MARKSLDSIIEGRTKLVVPEHGKTKGPAEKASVFYNPAMRTNRDITVLFGAAVGEPGWTYLDALGGTGAKGIRLAVESGNPLVITVNDVSSDAYEIILKNVEANKLEDVKASHMEFNALLSRSSYDWIDIDPYGSPVKFLDLAVQRLARGGILSITATDTAPLCGAKPEACLRRYMARPMRVGCSHELGLRILVGNTVRRAAVFDVGLEPLLAYYHGHYFRAFFKMKKGAGAADTQLSKIGFVSWDDNVGYLTHESVPDSGKFAGPLWIESLWKPEMVSKMLDSCGPNISKDTKGILGKMNAELRLPPYFYDADDMAQMTGKSPTKQSRILGLLKENGFKASGVHYSPKGFKTDAGLSELREIFNTASR